MSKGNCREIENTLISTFFAEAESDQASNELSQIVDDQADYETYIKL